jgi:hypothetical protein
MNNDLKIKPLLEYEVEFGDGGAETFTADSMVRDGETGDVLFYRTGNLIRVYTEHAGVRVIVVTPADDDVPQ